MNPDRLKEEITNLINKKIDIENLEKRIGQLKEHFIEADPALVAELTQKLHNGKDYQQNVRKIIEALKQNDLSGKDIDKISELIHKAKAIQIEFFELKQLESIKFIPAWIKTICSLILPKKSKSKPMEKKNIIDLSKELIHHVDQIDPISLNKKLKAAIKDNVSEEKAPAVLDKSLSEIFTKLKVIIWIKDAFDLLGKDKFSSQEINELKESEMDIKKVEKFKQLKYKYSNFKDHIDQIFEAKEEWLENGQNLLEEFDTVNIKSIGEEKVISDMKKKIETHQEKINEKIEKVSDVKDLYYKIQKNLEKLIWTETVQEMVRTKEKKDIVELEILYKKAIDLQINKEWSIFEGFEELYSLTQNIQLSTEKIRKSRQEIKNSSYSQDKPIHLFFQNNQNKITFSEAKQLKEQIELLEDKINVKDEMEEMDKDLLKCLNFDNNVNYFISKYHTVLAKDENDITKEEFEYIETDMHQLNEELFQIPILLDQKEKDLFLFEWCIISFQHLLGFKKASLEDWGQLFASSRLLSNPSQNILERIGTEISHYQKLNTAVQELKSAEKLGMEERIEKSKELRTYSEVQSLKKGLENCLIDTESEILYIQNLLEMAEEKINDYKEKLGKKDKHSMKFFKEILKNIRENLPFSIDEEFQIEESLKEGEYVKTELKQCEGNKQKQYEIVQRYRIQKIQIKELETLNKQFKEKEDQIEEIEQTLATFEETQDLLTLSYEQCHKFEDILSNDLKNELSKERIEECTLNLFAQKIKVLEIMWENEKELDMKYKDIYSLFQESDKKLKSVKSDIYDEDLEKIIAKLEESSSFLKKIIQSCDKKLKQIREISNLKQLDNLIKKESHCFCGFVSLKQEITTIREELHQNQKREKELERQIENGTDEDEEQEEVQELENEYRKYQKEKRKSTKKETTPSSSKYTKEELLDKSIRIKQKLKKMKSLEVLSEEQQEKRISLKRKLKMIQTELENYLDSTTTAGIQKKTISKKKLREEMKLKREYMNLEKREKERKEEMQKEKKKLTKRQEMEKLKRKIELMKIKEQQEIEERKEREIMKKKLKLRKQKEKQVKEMQIKNKIIGEISNSISDIEFFNYSIEESITVAKKIFKQLNIMSIENVTLESSDSNWVEMQKMSSDLVQVFENIKIYESICTHIKQNNFDWKYLKALCGKSDSFLEQEEHKLSMNLYFDRQAQDYRGQKIHKKNKKHELIQEQQQQSQRLLSTTSQQSQLTSVLGGKQSVGGGKLSSWKSQGGLDPLELRKQDLIAKKSIQKLNDRKSTVKNFSNYKQQPEDSKKKRYQQFSDDEDNMNNQQYPQMNQYPDGGNNLERMTEEDYEQLKEIMKAEQTRYQQKLARIPTMFDPDQQQQQQQGNAFQQQSQQQFDNGLVQDEGNNTEQEDDLTFQLASVDFDSENFYFDQVKLMSMHSQEDWERLPMSENLPMKISGKLQEVKVQEYVLNTIQTQETNRRDIVFTAGWLESMSEEQQQSLNEYALFLSTQQKMAVIEWAPECKMYLLHVNQIPQEWFDQANFAVLSETNQVCHLQFMCIYKAYKIDKEAQEKQKKLNIIKVQVDLQKLKQQTIMNDSLSYDSQSEGEQVQNEQFDADGNNLGLVLGGEDSKLQQQIEQLQQIQNKFVPRNNKNYVVQRKMQKYFGNTSSRPNTFNSRKPNFHFMNRHMNVNEMMQQQQQQQYMEDNMNSGNFNSSYPRSRQNSSQKKMNNKPKFQKMSHDELYEQWQQKQQFKNQRKQSYQQQQPLEYNQNNAINIQESYQQYDDENSQEIDYLQQQQMFQQQQQLLEQQQDSYMTDDDQYSMEDQQQQNYYQNQQRQSQQNGQYHQQQQYRQGKFSLGKKSYKNSVSKFSSAKRKRSFSHTNNQHQQNGNYINKKLFTEQQNYHSQQQQQEFNQNDDLQYQEEKLQQTILKQQQEIQRLTKSVQKKSVQKFSKQQHNNNNHHHQNHHTQQQQSYQQQQRPNKFQRNNQQHNQMMEQIIQPSQQVAQQQEEQNGEYLMERPSHFQSYNVQHSQQSQQSQNSNQSQQQQTKANTTFLRTREGSVESTISNISKASNVIPIGNMQVNQKQQAQQALLQMQQQHQQQQPLGGGLRNQNGMMNSKMKNSFLLDKEKSNAQVNTQRLKMFRI